MRLQAAARSHELQQRSREALMSSQGRRPVGSSTAGAYSLAFPLSLDAELQLAKLRSQLSGGE